MKKLYSISLLFLLFALVGCSSNSTLYSNEISYLPILSESTLVSHSPNENGLNEIIYKFDNLSLEDGLKQYKTVFEEDGWTFDSENSNEDDNVFKYTKDDHFAIVLFRSIDSENQYVVMTK